MSVKVMMSFFIFRLISIGLESVNILYTAVILGSAGSKKKNKTLQHTPDYVSFQLVCTTSQPSSAPLSFTVSAA
jgi:hypothetical protein